MNPRVLGLPGPFELRRVIEFEGPFAAPEHLFPDANHDAFAGTATSRDPRFYDSVEKRLIMAFHGIVLRTDRSTILIDACVGNNKHRPRNPPWHMRNGPFLIDMADAGLHPEQIDYVLCTHLHADHVGWNTLLRDGRWVPTFPNARYLFGRREVAAWQKIIATKDPDANHGSWPDSVQPILDAGLATIVDEDFEIEPGVRLVPAIGHSPGNVMVRLEQAGTVAFIAGDTVHHPVQVERPEWSSRFCWDAAQSRVVRRQLFETIADTGQWLIPAHFPTPTAARITFKNGGFSILP